MPAIQLPPYSSCLLSSAFPTLYRRPLSLYLWSFFCSSLDCACGGSACGGSRFVGEGKLVREARASAVSPVVAVAVKDGARFLPSRRILGRAITTCAINI